MHSGAAVNWSQRGARIVLALVLTILFIDVVYGYVYGLALQPMTKPPLQSGWSSIVTTLTDGLADPFGVAPGPDGAFYVTEAGRISRVDADGTVSLLAGDAPGFADGTGAAARFDSPSAIAVGPDKALYVADTGNNTIRRITPAGVVTTLTPNRMAGFRDGLVLDAQFNGPVGVAVAADGRVIVADTYNDRIRAIDRAGRVTTIAGSGARGYADGAALEATFDTPCGVAVDRDGTIYVADSGNGLIRRIDRNGTVATVDLSPEMFLLRPLGIAIAGDGHLYVTDDRGRVSEVGRDGGLRVVAGTAPGFADGPGADARLRGLAAVAVESPGRLVVADPRNGMLRRVTAVGQGDFAAPSPPRATPDFDEAQFAQQPLLWPIDPMEGPHEITGTQGEARGSETMERFHAGLDVHADEGTLVRAVRDGVVIDPVATASFGTLNESMRVGGLTYVHVRAGRDRRNDPFDDPRFVSTRDEKGKVDLVRVKRGARFATGDVIGSANPFNHVHLNVGWPGEEFNPLRFRLPFFADHVPPTINRIHLLALDGQPITARKRAPLVVDQPVQVVVDAWDQVDGNEKRRRLGLYRLGYQVLRRDGRPLAGFETPRQTLQFDRVSVDPAAPSLVYASGSGIPFYAGHATHFLYTVTNTFRDGRAAAGVWDPRGLPPGNYVIRVLAEDIAGNRAAAGNDLPIVIP